MKNHPTITPTTKTSAAGRKAIGGRRPIRLPAVLLAGTLLLAGCMSPAERVQTRQETRVETRTEHRMANRGW